MEAPVIDGPHDDSDIDRFCAVDAEAFAGSAAETRRWLDAGAGWSILRVARVDGEIVGGYALMPTGQFFGGRSVPAVAVAAVAVSTAYRRRGIAGALMRDLCAVARERGAALAPLFAASISLYRKWGWELCVPSLNHAIPTAALSNLRGAGLARPRPDRAAVEAMRRPFLAAWDGPLDRPDNWLAVEWDAGEWQSTRADYGWYEGDRLTGFIRYTQTHPGGTGWVRTRVREFIATTPDATGGLLGLLGSQAPQSTVTDFAHATLPPRSPLLDLLPDADKLIEVSGFLPWMERIVDVEPAFTARGWPSQAGGRVAFSVEDPVTGRTTFAVEVEGGRATVTPGGSGDVRCSMSALSAWYSSALTAREAAAYGWLEGEAAAISTMDSWATGQAWLPDFF